MKFMIISVLVLKLLSLVGAQEYCYATDSDPFRGYSTKTPYRDSLSGDMGTADDVEGCTAVKFWIVARHGTRYPGNDDIILWNQRLPRIREDADFDEAIDQGLMCQADVDAINAWNKTLQIGVDKRLAITGYIELLNLAARYQERFPHLLPDVYDPWLYEFRHTESEPSHRTRDSARAFATGLFGSYDGVEFIEVPEEEDWLLSYNDICDRYNQEVGDRPVIERDLFENGSEMNETIEMIEHRMQLPDGYLQLRDVQTIYDACRFEYAILGRQHSPWCAFFPEDITKVWEYYEDIEYYWEDGYGHTINYEQACVLVKDVYDFFTANTAMSAMTRFGHSANINTLLARLGLFRDDEDLRADNYDTMGDRRWQCSSHASMGSNIAFVQYECENKTVPEPSLIFKVFVNEQEVILPACDKALCEVPIDWWENELCDIEEICAIDL